MTEASFRLRAVEVPSSFFFTTKAITILLFFSKMAAMLIIAGQAYLFTDIVLCYMYVSILMQCTGMTKQMICITLEAI